MLVADIMHSCSNDKVAKVAVACIGGSFADRVQACAREKGLNSGKFVSLVVRHFARRADGDAYVRLNEKMAGADQPLLQGLRYIIETAMDDCSPLLDEETIETVGLQDGVRRRGSSRSETWSESQPCPLY
jgi:hypothetical protein